MLTPNEARSNREMISLGDSQALRTIRSLRYKNNNNTIRYDKDTLIKLQKEKKTIRRRKSSKNNTKNLLELEEKIDAMLFVPEYISVVIDNKKHYDYIIENGFYVNNKKFVRLLCSPGNARLDTVVFCDIDICDELKTILKNGANNIKMTDSKYNAYFSLVSSATHQVSSPRVLVVKDCIINMTKTVDWITEYKKKEDDDSINDVYDDSVDEVSKELEFNLFDGQGIISPEMAGVWSNELELDYIPSAFCIRNAYIKGMVCVMDIQKFARDIAKRDIENDEIIDYWGNAVKIKDIDMIVSESQFKLCNAYTSWQHYLNECQNNEMSWGVTRTTPKADGKTIFSNYQFIQVLNLAKDNIASLCAPTINWIEGVVGGSASYSLLYLLGKLVDNISEDKCLYNLTDDTIAKAIMLNGDMINDSYIKSTIRQSINKKIKQSYIGKLLLDGNFQVMISDPYAMLEHVFGLPVVGRLKEFEHYSSYWNNLRIDKVAAMRSPLTWRSEVNILNLKKYNKWYKYITSGIIYNVHGCDCMIAADSDYDFDIVCTTCTSEVINGAYGGNPITYEKKAVSKKIIDEDILYKADKESFNSKIGFVTNISTSYYVMYEYYKELLGENSQECIEILKRLKICRKEQGSQIDKTKGVIVKNFPKHWTNKININKDKMTKDEITKIEFNNKLVIDKRPYFFRYLYADYNKKYTKYISIYNKISLLEFGIGLKDLLLKYDIDNIDNIDTGIDIENDDDDKIKAKKAKKIIDDFKNNNPTMFNESIMNNVCRYMEHKIRQISVNITGNTPQDIINLMKSNYAPSDDAINKMKDLLKKFIVGKSSIKLSNAKVCDSDYNSLEHLYRAIRVEADSIRSNESEIATLAVVVCYEKVKSAPKDFVWNIFGEGILANIKNNSSGKITIPQKSDSGEILYLSNRYTMIHKEISDNEEV